ncbi:MAG: hypothetical protein A4E64_02024 [Syntrophorhabdus sp. PtaU1.Bin058]|nr:MAG: hypothetical protein A4E64_02024 [Syntrophorhabdus sp. PtaU1.Bin058]
MRGSTVLAGMLIAMLPQEINSCIFVQIAVNRKTVFLG